MFWRKALYFLVISILLVGGFAAPSGAEASKILAKSAITKSTEATTAITHTVCASGCDFSSIQAAIEAVTVIAGDTLSLAGETFTESFTINKDLTIQGISAESTIVQAAEAPGIATSRVVTITEGISVTIQGITLRYGKGRPEDEAGGGILNFGNLTLTYTDIVSNTAGWGGGIATGGSNSAINITDCNIKYNAAFESGGGLVAGSNSVLNNVTFFGNSAMEGGGMSNSRSSPILTDVTFSGNTADYGAGMANWESSPILTDVIFIANIGDGMRNISNSSPTLTNVTFSGNSSWGMVNDENSNPTLNDVIFSGNSEGGMVNSYSNPTLNNVIFSNNIGSGMVNGFSNPILTNVTFSSNSDEYYGGGMLNDNSSPTLTNVVFSGNSADSGGGMYNSSSNPVLTNVIFFRNSAMSQDWAGHGGGMSNVYSSPVLTNVTFFGNTANDAGGGLYNNNSNPALVNTIFWGNTAGTVGDQIYNNGGTPVISYSLIQDSDGSGAGWDSMLGIDQGGNIDADPLFVDISSDDYHLKLGSPAIDTADTKSCPGFDLDGIPRPLGLGCDMGVYEYWEPLMKSVNHSTPNLGETITYKIDLVNATTETVTGGLISDTLPVGLEFIGPITLDPPSAGSIGISPPTLVTDLEINPGQKTTVTFPVLINQDVAYGTEIINTAWFTSSSFTTPVSGSSKITITSRIFLPCVFNHYCPNFFDDFSDPTSGWFVGDDQYHLVDYFNQEYRILTKQSEYIYLFRAPTCASENYVVEADLRWNGEDYGYGYGLLFGLNEDYSQFYYFEVLALDNYYRLWRLDSTGFTWFFKFHSDAIKSGTGVNHLKVTRVGDQISMNINGTDLATWTDDVITGLTYLGVATNPYPDKPVSDLRVDNFSVEYLSGGSTSLMQTNNAVPVLTENVHFQERDVNLAK